MVSHLLRRSLISVEFASFSLIIAGSPLLSIGTILYFEAVLKPLGTSKKKQRGYNGSGRGLVLKQRKRKRVIFKVAEAETSDLKTSEPEAEALHMETEAVIKLTASVPLRPTN